MALAPDPKQPTAKTAAAPTASGKKTITYTIAKGSKAAAPTTGGAAGTGGGGSLADVASSRAAMETNATIAGYRALQDYANQQGLLRATQQGQLGLAASKYLEGLHLPERTTSDYAAAAAAQRAAAQGYSGGLQQTVSDAAANVQANLNATGSSQTAYNQSEAAGNALYALGGALPATQFGVTGPTVAASLRALPAQALGYGQQLALGQLGAGQQEAAKFNADIVGALAKQGPLAASYLDTLSAAQQKAIADAQDAAYQQASLNARIQYQNATLNQRADIANATLQQRHEDANKVQLRGSLSTGIVAFNPATGKVTVVAEPQAPPKSPTVKTFGGDGIMRINPDGNVEILQQPTVDAPTPRIVTGEDAKGKYAANLTTGEKVYIGGPTPRSSSAGHDTTDKWGRPIRVLPSGKIKVLGPGLWENPVTHATYQVSVGGKLTPFTKGKKPSGSKPPRLGAATTARYTGIAEQIAKDFHDGYFINGEPVPLNQRTKARAVIAMRTKGVPPQIIAEIVNRWWVTVPGELSGHHD